MNVLRNVQGQDLVGECGGRRDETTGSCWNSSPHDVHAIPLHALGTGQQAGPDRMAIRRIAHAGNRSALGIRMFGSLRTISGREPRFAQTAGGEPTLLRSLNRSCKHPCVRRVIVAKCRF